MERLIAKELTQWAVSKKHKPIILRGARQVGKTYSVKQLARDSFDNDILVVDFEQEFMINTLFEKDLDVKKILRELELHFGRKITIGKTLLFFDEIQECPRAIMSLRYFYEQIPELHVIAAGSLLEFILKDISFPVGRVHFLHMYPLTFFEFLLALKKDNLAELIGKAPQELSDIIHQDLFSLLRQYFFVGGMPEAVNAFVSTNSFQESFIVHKDLTASFREDFAKYAGHADKLCIEEVFLSTVRNIGQQIKYSHLSSNYSSPTIKKAFGLLCKAQLIQKVASINHIGLPLGASILDKVFKAIALDIGIMQSLLGISVEIEYKKENLLGIYRGALAEQFIAQELRVLQEHSLFYWSRQEKSSSAEVDYVISLSGNIIPVEVKSGASGRLKSLHMFLEKSNHSPYGIVFYEGKYASLKEQKLYFYPLYYVCSLLRCVK